MKLRNSSKVRSGGMWKSRRALTKGHGIITFFQAHQCGTHEPRFTRRYTKHTVFGFGHVLLQWPQAHAQLIMVSQGSTLLLSTVSFRDRKNPARIKGILFI